MSQSVLKDWVVELPLMMQGTLMTCIRGNDIRDAPKMKPLTRWLRSLLLNNGNPENDFMEVPKLPAVEEFEDEIEYLSIHYFAHLLHSLEIVGHKHPDDEVAGIAIDYYARLVDFLHLEPEREEEFEKRLSGEVGTTGSVRKWLPNFKIRVLRQRAEQASSKDCLLDAAKGVLQEHGYYIVESPEHMIHGRIGS